MDTFLVRVWTESEPLSHPASTARQPGTIESLHGVARHVRTGVETRFSTPAELLAFLSTGPESQVSAGSIPAESGRDSLAASRADGSEP